MDKIKLFTNEIFKLLVIVITISSILITIITNFDIDPYIKYFIIPTIILISCFLIIMKKIKLIFNKKAYYLFIPIFLILCSYLIIDIDMSNMFLNLLIIPILLSMFFLTLVSNEYHLSRFVEHFLSLFPNRLFNNLKFIKLAFANHKKSQNIYNILIGCIIGIPIAIILLLLLSSADMYFSKFIDNIFNFIYNFININNFLSNLIIFIGSFVILFSVFTNILHYRNKPLNKRSNKKINTSIATTVLWIINFVFILFLMSELSKITFNFLNLPVEYTYSQYAREGFFQLLGVTIINIAIIIYFIYYTNAIKNNKMIKNLILTLVFFSILLIFNSYYRMFLYISTYGFTILRLQVIIFLAMEFVLFTLIAKKIIYKIKYNEALIYLIVILVTYILNVYFCTNPIITIINNIIN